MTNYNPTTPARFRPGAACPWDDIQSQRKIADGIHWVSCAGHAGFMVERHRYNEMPQHLRECSFTKDQWFEEDCSWCAVPLAFPQHFSPGMVAAAQSHYDRVYSNLTYPTP